MKFTTAFIASFIAYTSFVSAFPVATHHRRQYVNTQEPEVPQGPEIPQGSELPQGPEIPQGPEVPKSPEVPQECTPPIIPPPAQQNGTMTGAVYFMTNEPNGNFIVSSAIGPDGKITPTNAVYTGGKGAHGKPAEGEAGPDPLFTQDSIKVGKNFLFTVNAGSNSLTMFKINELQPTELSMVGMPVDTQGDFPVAVAFSSKMNMACVVNGGAVDGVACFKVDENKGLVPVSNTNRPLNLKQTTPATGPPNTVSDIIFNEDETQLLVAIKGIPPTPGRISAFDVNPEDGSLSETSVDSTPSEGGIVPFSMTNIPGKNAILNTDAAVGFAVYDFSQGTNATANSTIIPIEGQGATCWSNFSPKTGTFFLTDIVTSTVTEVKVDDELVGSIVKQYPLAAGSGTIDNAIATIGGNDFLYVLSANVTSIDVMSLPAAGQATSLQTVDFSPLAAQVGLVVSSLNLQGIAVFVKE